MTDLEGAASPRATGPGAAGTFSQRSLAWLVLALAAGAAIALISSHSDYIPMWDGRAYAECAVEASLHGLAPFYLRCWGHASHLYLGLLAISQLFDTGNPIALIAVNAIILAVGVAGFHRLTRVVFPVMARAWIARSCPPSSWCSRRCSRQSCSRASTSRCWSAPSGRSRC